MRELATASAASLPASSSRPRTAPSSFWSSGDAWISFEACPNSWAGSVEIFFPASAAPNMMASFIFFVRPSR